MAVYRFRITFEEHEDVYREIEVLGKQTYEDLHRAIQEAISFDNTKDASFFLSDDLWRKGQEIALKPPANDDDDDDDFPRGRKKEVKQMSKCRIADFIDDPHQKLIYVSDPEVKWTLLVELVKILADDPKAHYPSCVKTAGAAPKQYKQKLVPPPVDEDEEEDDEEDKKAPERAFTAVETFDEAEHTGDTEEGEEEAPGEEGEEGEEGGEESDFDAGSYSDKDSEDY